MNVGGVGRVWWGVGRAVRRIAARARRIGHWPIAVPREKSAHL